MGLGESFWNARMDIASTLQVEGGAAVVAKNILRDLDSGECCIPWIVRRAIEPGNGRRVCAGNLVGGRFALKCLTAFTEKDFPC